MGFKQNRKVQRTWKWSSLWGPIGSNCGYPFQSQKVDLWRWTTYHSYKYSRRKHSRISGNTTFPLVFLTKLAHLKVLKNEKWLNYEASSKAKYYML